MKRVFFAQIMHETDTFSVLPTGEEAYMRRYLNSGDEILSHFKGT